MAEMLQFEFPIAGKADRTSEKVVPKEDLKDGERTKTHPTTDLPEVLGETTPEEYTIDLYYQNDELGKEVLKAKYLAPWEKSP